MAKSAKSFIIPAILWSYILSVTCAIKFSGTVYDKLMMALDLSPNQGWMLPLAINFLVACIGVPQITTFIISMRRAEKAPLARWIAVCMTILAAGLSLRVSGLGIIENRKHLAKAASELVGGTENNMFVAGQIVTGIYSNKIVGVMMAIPKDWQPMTLNSIRQSKLSGATAIAGEDARQAEDLAASRPGMYTLLAVRRYPLGHKGYNPTLSLYAYDKQAFAAEGIPTLQDYAKGVAGVEAPYHLRSGPSWEHFGSVAGYHVHVEGRFPQATVQQHVYATETSRFYVVAVAALVDQADWAAMQIAITSLHLSQGATKQ